MAANQERLAKKRGKNSILVLSWAYMLKIIDV